MAEIETTPTDDGPRAFLASIEHDTRRSDGLALLQMMSEETGEAPRMWGPSIVGFGSYHYVYESGREGDAARVGFSPRKASLSLYGLTSAPESEALLARLGKYKVGKSCLYVNKLADVDEDVLRELIRVGFAHAEAC